MRTSSLRALLLAVPFAVGLLGCDPEGDEVSDGTTQGAGKADSPGGEEALELAPVYAVRVTSDVEVRNEVGEIVTHTTEVVGLAHVEQDGADVQIELATCAIELPAADFEPRLSRDVAAGLDVVSIPAVAFFGPDGEPRLEADPAAILAGVVLDNPRHDTLPEDPDDARVFDQDGDGRPGVSVSVSAFTVFAAARVAFTLTGTFAPDGTIEGDAAIDLDFAILGDTIPFVDAREVAEESAANSEVLSEDHRFELVPVLEATCNAALMAAGR